MSYYIGIEDLAANALIEIVENTGERTVSFSQLNKYGENIINELKERDIDANLLYHRDLTNKFFNDCADCFNFKETNSETYVTLNDKTTTKDLRKRFRTRLSLDILKSFISKEALRALLM